MKPKEFDELIRQKFDRNDFEYNPRNWDSLAEELDGRAKKRSLIMWWWMPLAGVAASVALAMGLTTFWQQPERGKVGIAAEHARKFNFKQSELVQTVEVPVAIEPEHKDVQYAKSENKQHTIKAANKEEDMAEHFGISLQNVISYTQISRTKKVELAKTAEVVIPKTKEKKKEATTTEVVYTTFKPEEVRKAPKLTINLSGGVSHGNQNSGFTAGATVRRMINDKVFVEGDVAFASSNNTQDIPDVKYVYGKPGLSKSTATDANKPTVVPQPIAVPYVRTASYNLSYALVSPSIGYKIIKKISIAAGPDFQQVLADNRPAPSTTDHGTLQQAPLFDIGFTGKTEYSITRGIKAGVSYRKGINNVLTPMGKFIDRDYLQFQVKCAIFNK
jgi:hypothetical protein